MRLRQVDAERGCWTTRTSERPSQERGKSFLANGHAHGKPRDEPDCLMDD